MTNRSSKVAMDVWHCQDRLYSAQGHWDQYQDANISAQGSYGLGWSLEILGGQKP